MFEPQRLLIAADIYDLPQLKEHCERCLELKLDSDNVVEFLVVADSYHCSRLKMTCLAFIKNHLAQAMASAGWAAQLASNAPLLNESIEHNEGITATSESESRGTKRGRDEYVVRPTSCR